MVFGRPHPTVSYCRDETDPIVLCGVVDFVADYESGEMENGGCGKDSRSLGQMEPIWAQMGPCEST